MTTLQLPKGFLWGAAMSGPQTEGVAGKKHESIMDTWSRTHPEDFYQQVGSHTVNDIGNHLDEDFSLMKKSGIKSLRTSIQWTRLIDDLETGSIDEKGARFYQAMIDAAKRNDIELVFNLHHFDLPTQLLEKYGGWQSRHVVDLFGKFAAAAFHLFGKQVKLWATFNEPMVIVDGGYLYGYHYPKYQNKSKAAVQVMVNIVLANALAVKIFHESGQDGKIGMILNLTPAYPASNGKEDLEAAHFFDLFHSTFFMDSVVKGNIPAEFAQLLGDAGVFPDVSLEDLQLLKENTVDFIGINYYHPTRIQARMHSGNFDAWMPDQYYEHFNKPGIRMNPHKSWEIYPKAIYDIAKMIQNDYNNIPWYLSECGIGVHNEDRFRNKNGQIEDEYRIDFYKEHLEWLHKAIEEGSSCFGFHAWTSIDNWSWNNAYRNRYGFIELNVRDGTRRLKKSADWMRETSSSNSFTINSKS